MPRADPLTGTPCAGTPLDGVDVLLAESAMLEDGVYQTARAQPILRGGGPADYFTITEDSLFKMRRPG